MNFEAEIIKDIAKDHGLSTSTVSRALRDNYEISPETKQLVPEGEEKINYYPNPIALSIKERRSRSTGIVIGKFLYDERQHRRHTKNLCVKTFLNFCHK